MDGEEIGPGGRDHSTVWHAGRAVDARAAQDGDREALRAQLDRLKPAAAMDQIEDCK